MAFWAKYWHCDRPKMMQTRCLGGFSVTWVPKLLLPPVGIRIFDPITAKFGPKCAFLVILGQILAFSALFVPCPTKKQPTFTFFTSNNLVWTFLIYTTFWVSKTDLKKRADFRLAVFHQKRREWGDTIRHKTAPFSKIKKPSPLKWLMIMFRA